jgi:GntR family transcriptional regulator
MLDPGSRMPLYCQVEERLREAIRAGRWRVGDLIPPERVLIETFGVSRITIRQALANLAAAGLLRRKPGQGTFVAGLPDQPITESLASMKGHLEELQERGLDPQVRTLALEARAMPTDVAEALERRPGTPGWCLYRLVSVGAQPLMISTVWLPRDLGIDLDEAMVGRDGMAPLLIRHGLFPARGRQRIGAATAGPEEAALLEIAPGEAVLRVVRTLCDQADRPLVWFRTLYRADRYEYELELRREKAS